MLFRSSIIGVVVVVLFPSHDMWWPSGGSVCGYSWQLGVAEGQGDFGAGGGVHAEWVGPVDKLGFPGDVCRVKKWGFCPLDAVGREMGGVLCNV